MGKKYKVELVKKQDSAMSCIMLNDRWAIYSDGVVYDTTQGKNIPSEVFDFRDFLASIQTF